MKNSKYLWNFNSIFWDGLSFPVEVNKGYDFKEDIKEVDECDELVVVFQNCTEYKVLQEGIMEPFMSRIGWLNLGKAKANKWEFLEEHDKHLNGRPNRVQLA